MPRAPKKNDSDLIKDGKAASRKATKAKTKNTVNREAKKLADKTVMDIAASLPAGQGNTFVKLHTAHNQIELQIAAVNKAKREVRSQMKAIKIDMSCYDRVNKLSKMDPEDVRAKKTTEALYEKQLSMELSDEQKAAVEEINKKRDEARKAMAELTGSDAGKEVGSAAHAPEADEDEDDAPPSRNDDFRSSNVVALAAAPARL